MVTSAKNELESISRAAYNALIFEVRLSPKPGLVDERNNGSHSDMSVDTFLSSADALLPYFINYAKLGYEHADDDMGALFIKLRDEGILAEEAMFNATNGVNTHKGANFTFALFLGALGFIFKKNGPSVSVQKNELFDIIKQLADGLMNDFERENLTNGISTYKKYGAKGVRGEAIMGYPTVQRLLENTSIDENDKFYWHKLLLEIILFAEDANLLHRGGREGLKYAQSLSSELLNSDFQDFENQMIEADEKFIEKNLSPGGSADLLAIIYFLNKLNLN
ncbi:triphosphoribosyl-dephospho-CoA synthase [Floricoccus penangensis]|uniref:triphosphoribosyl-dephospho-CoA synthase n=1 Tax=Floricoccus penangensis TaxID=1859475 RepID=UPI002041F383|nr:triphosphoribosyl-dephospho-CoA synthase [Floricoccus penangensis]URZ87250.1 triphosphoribosyl-dephospho-CoA synthase [Floricoccus penangensis]